MQFPAALAAPARFVPLVSTLGHIGDFVVAPDEVFLLARLGVDDGHPVGAHAAWPSPTQASVRQPPQCRPGTGTLAQDTKYSISAVMEGRTAFSSKILSRHSSPFSQQ